MSSLPDELNHDVHGVHSWAIYIQARMRTISRGMPGVKKKKKLNLKIEYRTPTHRTNFRIIKYSGPALETTQPLLRPKKALIGRESEKNAF